MARMPHEGLTARENQIMNVLWQRGEATVEEIRDRLNASLAGSTIRTLLNIMEEKGYVDFYKQSKAKVFRPLVEKREAQSSALRMLKERLFHGSTSMLLARLVEDEDISPEEFERLRSEIRNSNQQGEEP